MRPLVVVLASLLGCGHTVAPDPPREIGSAGSSGSATAAGTLSDEECLARGGQIVTEQTYAHLRDREPNHPVTPFRICRIPSPKNGATCSADGDCAGGHCFCVGALARPNPHDDPTLRALDGTAATGACSDQPLSSGSWYCLVEGGKVMLHGIIVD